MTLRFQMEVCVSGLQEEQWWELGDVHISYYFMSDFLFNSLSVFIDETGFRAGREWEDGGSMMLRC